jgi:hypothetical protein
MTGALVYGRAARSAADAAEIPAIAANADTAIADVKPRMKAPIHSRQGPTPPLTLAGNRDGQHELLQRFVI